MVHYWTAQSLLSSLLICLTDTCDHIYVLRPTQEKIHIDHDAMCIMAICMQHDFAT